MNGIINVSGNRLTSEQLARLRAAVAVWREAAEALALSATWPAPAEAAAYDAASGRLRKLLAALGLAAVPPELWDGEAGE